MFAKIQEQFEKNKFYVYDNFLSKDECKELSDKFFDTLENNPNAFLPNQVKNSKEIYTPFPDIGIKYENLMSDITGKSCKFSYCFGRLYKKGSFLTPHIDRDSCEYSVTIPLAFSMDTNWSISFRDLKSNKVSAVSQPIGNGAVYKGRELWHWRPPLQTEWSLHLFLHYVDNNGKYFMHANEYTRA